MAGCRDCPRCTEAGLKGLLALPWRIFYGLFFGWWIGLFRKNCPQCHHRLSWHQRDQAGRFAD